MSRFGIGFLLLALAAAAAYFLAFPQWQKILALRADIQSLQALNTELTALAEKSEVLQQEYNAIPEADLEKLRSIAPATADTSRVLSDLENLAQRNQLLLSRVEFTAAAQGAVTELQLPVSRPYTAIPVTMQLSGSYESLRAFLVGLEHNLRLLDVNSISFSSASDKGFSIGIGGKMYYRRAGP
ncbi:MAG: type 4a pilus biogenesis protein PilO [Candidatus Sungbacteria bacterium]|uniref:Type 4a pilus biogenesis protein PilO n=1 Tax=Candidatus Sungiibacteriota bacterium TaxID=2750080 RepID=A0A932YZ29_9BACT|nr:type 4a pilus biogenesis protein PilO [Candidatus Sungbacteria bacterium]